MLHNLIYKSLFRNSDSRSRNGNGGHSRSRYGRQEYSESHCWNGKDTGRYTSNIVADGLAYQDRNPEVRVDINRPDVDINEQIFALKLITKKLESAHKGQNVDWPSTSSCKCSVKLIINETKIFTESKCQIFIFTLPSLSIKFIIALQTLLGYLLYKITVFILVKNARGRSIGQYLPLFIM